jgi:hypothetical protein
MTIVGDTDDQRNREHRGRDNVAPPINDRWRDKSTRDYQ